MPNHRLSDGMASGGLRIELGHYSAVVHHQQAVGQHQELVEVLGDQQDGDTSSPLGHQEVLDRLDALDVETSGRLGRNHNLRMITQLAPDQQPLQVPTRQSGDRFVQGSGPHAESVDEVLAVIGRRSSVKKRTFSLNRGARPTPIRSSGI